MTGEITLSGQVLAVGGIREKLLAAHRAGIPRVVIPRENEPDLDELPTETRRPVAIVLVDTADEASWRPSTPRRNPGASGPSASRRPRARWPSARGGSSRAVGGARRPRRRRAGGRAAGTRSGRRGRTRCAEFRRACLTARTPSSGARRFAAASSARPHRRACRRASSPPDRARRSRAARAEAGTARRAPKRVTETAVPSRVPTVIVRPERVTSQPPGPRTGSRRREPPAAGFPRRVRHRRGARRARVPPVCEDRAAGNGEERTARERTRRRWLRRTGSWR